MSLSWLIINVIFLPVLDSRGDQSIFLIWYQWWILRETLRNCPQLPHISVLRQVRKLATQASNTEKTKNISPCNSPARRSNPAEPRPIQLLQTLRAMDGEFRVKPWLLLLCVFVLQRCTQTAGPQREKREKGHPLFPAGIFMGVLIFSVIFSDFLSWFLISWPPD